MWEELNDMPGEIFDVPDIETVLVEDENGELGVDLTDINNWPMMPLLPMTQTMDNVVDRDELQASLINTVIDGMDFKTMWSVLCQLFMQRHMQWTRKAPKTR